MKLTFIGANHEVTGSCTLLSWQGKYAVIDCGMEQGQNEYENAPLPVPASAISCVFLTHAHIDHTGNLPLLYRQGFRGKVYTTRATTNLCAIMLADSAHIQMQDAEYKSRKAQRAGKPPVEPAYDMNDVHELLKCFRPCDYDEDIWVDDGLMVRFTDAGHMMGSASVSLTVREGDAQKKIVFSGDVGNLHQPILKDPVLVKSADYLVIESTYGDRSHQRSEVNPTQLLADIIQRTLDKGGNVVIPAFAVGRTQEMLYMIREIKMRGMVKGHDGFPVYVDSPLAAQATAVFLQCDASCVDPETLEIMEQGENPIAFDGMEITVSADESKALNANKTPKVIISASGMCDAGRIRHHLKHNLWRAESAVVFVGYQAQGSMGRMLQDGRKEVRLFGETVQVACEIQTLPGVSGHADQEGLMRFVDGFTEKMPQQIFVNHGEHEPAENFAADIRERHHVKVDVPYSGSTYDLVTGQWEHQASGVLIPRKEKAPVPSAYDKFVATLRRLMDSCELFKGKPDHELTQHTSVLEKILKRVK